MKLAINKDALEIMARGRPQPKGDLVQLTVTGTVEGDLFFIQRAFLGSPEKQGIDAALHQTERVVQGERLNGYGEYLTHGIRLQLVKPDGTSVKTTISYATISASR